MRTELKTPAYVTIRSLAGLCALLMLPMATTQAQQAAAVDPANTQSQSVLTTKDVTKNRTATTSSDENDVVNLPRFEVSASTKEDGYRATDTLAGTRLKSDLRDVAASISVVTSKFLQDTGATNNLTLLRYTTNTEVGGIGGNYTGATGEGINLQNNDGSLLNPNQNTRVRGLMEADNSRDYVGTGLPWDSYNIDRVDLQRGPNSILFGLGSPAGLINVSTKQAGYIDKGEVGFQFGSYGSNRLTLDFNKVLLSKQLAVHFDFLNNDTEYRQEPAFDRSRRFYGALRADPKFLDKNGMHTTIKVNYEHADINANRPNSMPPADQITPWFQTGNSTVISGTSPTGQPIYIPNLNKSTYNGLNALQLFPQPLPLGYGTMVQGSGQYQPWIGGMGSLNSKSPATVFQNQYAASPTSTGLSDNSATFFTTGTNGVVDGHGLFPFYIAQGITSYSGYATSANLPNAHNTPYYDRSLTDPSIFNFWDNLLAGPNNHQTQRFDAATINLNQTFFHNRVGVEFIYDNQRSYSAMVTGIDMNAISVDVNEVLVDGSPNPNLGRPYVDGSNMYGNFSSRYSSDTYRVTAYGELNFSDFMNKDAWLTRLLGRHVFTVFGSYSDTKNESRTWTRYALGADYISAQIQIGGPLWDANATNYQVGHRALTPSTITYIGPSLLGNQYTTASGLNLNGLKTVQKLPSSMPIQYFNSHWIAPANVSPSDPWTHIATSGTFSGQAIVDTQNNNPANYVGWMTQNFNLMNSANPTDINQMYTGGNKSDVRLKSMGAVWQGFFWDGVVVPTIGFRQDKVTDPSTGTAVAPYFDPKYQGAVSMNYAVSQMRYMDPFNSHSYGVVIHMPKNIVDKMPLKTELSLFAYNGQNYQVGAAAVDIYGKPIPMPEGKTKEYGVLLNTLNNRVSLKVTWYETNVKNARLNASLKTYILGRVYSVYAVEAKQQATGLAQKDIADGTPGKVYRAGQEWVWDWSGNGDNVRASGGTQALTWAAEKTATDAFLARPVDMAFCQAWGINPDSDAWKVVGTNVIPQTVPPGLNSSTDMTADGVEIEFTGHPVDGLDITFNASKNTAQRANVGGSIKAWTDSVNDWLQGPAGDIRLWYGGNGPTQTIRNDWNTSYMAGYNLIKQLNGTDVPELRPWRFNFIANYSFQKSWAKGISIGGAYRWEDRVIIGYKAASNGYYDLSSPVKGPNENHVDMWIGYSHRLTRSIDWRIQLNVHDMLAKKQLVPVTVQPDGTSAGYRIPSLTTWDITNTIMF